MTCMGLMRGLSSSIVRGSIGSRTLILMIYLRCSLVEVCLINQGREGSSVEGINLFSGLIITRTKGNNRGMVGKEESKLRVDHRIC